LLCLKPQYWDVVRRAHSVSWEYYTNSWSDFQPTSAQPLNRDDSCTESGTWWYATHYSDRLHNSARILDVAWVIVVEWQYIHRLEGTPLWPGSGCGRLLTITSRVSDDEGEGDTGDFVSTP